MPRTLIVSNLTPDTTITFDSLTVNNNATIGGTAFFADGTVAAPSITFTSDTDAGFYRAGGNDMRFAAAGSDRVRFIGGTGIAIAATEYLYLASTGTSTAAPAGQLGADAAGLTINEDGADSDVRIESDTNANHFISDAGLHTGAGAFGFGTTAAAGSFLNISPPSGVSNAINTTSGNVNLISGDLKLSTAGYGLYVKQGTNATFGTVTLSSGGSALVYSTKLTANSVVFTTHNLRGGTVGTVSIGTLSSGAVQFLSTSTTDTSTIGWVLIEPS